MAYELVREDFEALSNSAMPNAAVLSRLCRERMVSYRLALSLGGSVSLPGFCRFCGNVHFRPGFEHRFALRLA